VIILLFSHLQNADVAPHDDKDKKILTLYSDFTCPMCYLAFLRLRQALQELPPEQRVHLKHGPYQMDATLPEQGVDKYAFLSTLMPPEVLDQIIEELSNDFRTEYGMEMEPRGLLGNSAAAHRLALYAQDNYPEDVAWNLKESLFQIHCLQGKSMGDPVALREAARSCGLMTNNKMNKDASKAVEDVLGASDKKYAAAMGRQIMRAQEILGINEIPALVLSKKELGDCQDIVLPEAKDIKTVKGFKELLEIKVV